MSIFHRGKYYRLSDREPEKEKKPREVQHYKPPRPLSWLSCVILLLFGAALTFYGGSLLLLRFAGTETQAAANTRLANGEVVPVELRGITTTVSYTYRDEAGALHEGTTSLFGNTEPITDTISVRYLPAIPGWHTPSFRTADLTTPMGSLLLAVILICVGISRLVEIRREKE